MTLFNIDLTRQKDEPVRTWKTPPPRFDDAEIVRRCLNGDTEAFGKLVEKYQGAVYATAYAYLRNRESSLEVLQEAFWTAYTNLGQLRNTNAFAPWLKEITCRKASQVAKEERRRTRFETPFPLRKVISIEEARDHTADVGTQTDVRAAVLDAIDALPEQYRLVVVLRYLQELTYNEIADFLGESYDEVRGTLQKAGKMLRDALNNTDFGNERGSAWHRVPR